MAGATSLVGRLARWQRGLVGAPLPVRGFGGACAGLTGPVQVRCRTLATLGLGRAVLGRSVPSASIYDGRGMTVRRCGLGEGQLARIQQSRCLHLSRTLHEQSSGKKISNKVSAATSKILSSLPIPQHENIYTVPNILTFSRLLAAPVVGWAILADHPTLALSLFAYAAVTDLVDGFVARHFNQESVVGTIIDPMADKLLMTVGVVCLSLQHAIPLWLATLIIGRDLGLGLSALYFRWISLPPPKTMARYWDFSLPSAEVKPTLVSKVNTALQLALVWSAMAVPVLSEGWMEAWGVGGGMVGLQYLVAVTTVWSGLSYVFSKNAVKILSEKDVRERLARQVRKAVEHGADAKKKL